MVLDWERPHGRRHPPIVGLLAQGPKAQQAPHFFTKHPKITFPTVSKSVRMTLDRDRMSQTRLSFTPLCHFTWFCIGSWLPKYSPGLQMAGATLLRPCCGPGPQAQLGIPFLHRSPKRTSSEHLQVSLHGSGSARPKHAFS